MLLTKGFSTMPRVHPNSIIAFSLMKLNFHWKYYETDLSESTLFIKGFPAVSLFYARVTMV
jgi:hypothetical protein